MAANTLPRLFLARHGDTAWTVTHQKTGRTDLPLTAQGQQHAQQIGAELRRFTFSRVFTSPLKRAAETCRLAGFGGGIEVDPDLVEWDYGRFEGKRTGEVLQQCPGWELFRDGCPEGESPGDVAARADRFIARVRELSGDVLAFSSGHISRMIAARWFGLSPEMGRIFYCDTASVGILGFEHDNSEEPVIRLWNYATFPRE